jgi:integrase
VIAVARGKTYPGIRSRDGRYTFRYSESGKIDPLTGKAKRVQKESISYPTAKEAYDAKILFESDRLRGKKTITKKLLLGSWNKKWLQDYEVERGVKPSTIATRKFALTVLEKHFGEACVLGDISKAEYQTMLNTLKKKGMTEGSIKTVHSGCSTMFRDAVRKEVIPESPTAGAVVPKMAQNTVVLGDEDESELPEYLEKDELKTFLQLARFRCSTPHYVAFVLLAYTGLRIGELGALQRADIDRKTKTVRINKTLYFDSKVSQWQLLTPKAKASKRNIRYGDTLAKALELLEKWRSDEYGDRTIQKGKPDFLFTSIRNPEYPLVAEGLRSDMREILKLANLPSSLTPHSLRHTHVSLLAANPKITLAEIQARVGHKNGSTVTNIYTHVTKSRRKEIADDFEWAINS